MQPTTPSDSLVPFADGVWLAHAPVSFLGLRLTSTMVVLRLPERSLLVVSPLALTPERRAAVEALGPVAHLYAPNLYHHAWIQAWAAAFPTARVHAPRGLEKKHPRLRVDRWHGPGAPAAPAFTAAGAPTIEELPVEGFRLGETALFHHPSRTLVVADLLQNIGRPSHGWTRTYARMMGFYDRRALSRAIRWTAFNDRKAARRSVDAILDRAAERLIVGHGEPLVTGGHDAVAGAYGWLRG
jgi:hypothetical protein